MREECTFIKKKRSVSFLCLLFVICTSVMGCATSSPQANEDILTQKKTQEGRTQITVLVKHAFSIHQFEKIVEDKFPDIDIVQVANYTANTTLAKEYEARLEHGDLTDIILTWPLDVGETYWKDQLIDLSGLPFTSKYNISMLDAIATDDGCLYYLPGPAEIRGIIYNKTMFEENNWKVPENYTEFIALCKTIEASGMRAFQLPLGNAEVLDTAFIGFNYGDAYSKPADTQWLAEYNEGKGKFIEHFDTALSTFQNLIDEGVLESEDLNLNYAHTQANLVNRKIAMTEESVLMVNLAASMGNETDEFALMPFFNRTPENDWARIYMTCFIGLNKNLQTDENKEKYSKVLELMEYISTTEGQKALASDNGAMFSSLKGVEVANVAAIENLRSPLSQGRYATFPTLKRSEQALRKGLAAMLKKEMNAEQVADLIDEENANPVVDKEDVVYANALENFSMIDTGNFVCDILKQEAGSEIALFLDNGKDGFNNGKGISAKLYQGEVTETDVLRIFPDLKTDESGELVTAMMTGEHIKKALENTLSDNDKNNWFYYFSGLQVEMDPSAEVGSRIKKVMLSNGEQLIDEKEYSVAFMENSVDESLITSTIHTDKLIMDVLRNHLLDLKTISPAHDNRFIIK